MSWRSRAVAAAGPLLIVAFVLFALRGFVFADRLTNEHPDILAFWLPRWTFLGRTLAAGHLPLWNPYEMIGYRFAADPQSGWLYAPPMLLFSTLAPSVAMRAMIVLQPLLGGLGLFAFLRTEGSGRSAATFGGLALVGLTGASEIAIAMPFAGALAWGVIVLLAAARCLRAARWAGRLGWVALGGFAWSQMASAHLSHGLVVGTTVVVAYVLGMTWGRRDLRWPAAVFLGSLPLLSLAVLVPRFQALSVSSLAQGYDALGSATRAGADAAVAPISEGSVWLGWPLAFATAPGAYLGAAALLAAPLALRARRRCRLVVPVTIVLAGTWLLLALVGVDAFRAVLERLPFGDVLLHNPARLRYVAVLVLPILAATGLQGLVDDPLSRDRAWVWVAGAAILWVGVPLALGAAPLRWVLVAAALVPAAWALTRTANASRWAPGVVVGLLAVELVTGATWGSLANDDDLRTGLEGPTGGPLAFQPLRDPNVDAAAYVRPTAFVARIADARYLTWAPPAAAYEKGYLFAQDPVDWPALANERGTLFGIRDALGYNPLQLPRYWSWIRARNPLPMYYNTSVLARPTLGDLWALGVEYLVVPHAVPPPVDGSVVATADGYDLISVPHPRLPPHGDVRRVSATELRIDDPASIVWIDEAYDPGWKAVTDDGRVASVVPDDPAMEIEVPTGASAVTLTYRDPWVLGGLWAGAIAWLCLGLAWLLTGRSARRT